MERRRMKIRLCSLRSGPGKRERERWTPGAICVRNKSRRTPNNFLSNKISTFIHNYHPGLGEVVWMAPWPIVGIPYCVQPIKRIDRVFHCFYDPHQLTVRAPFGKMTWAELDLCLLHTFNRSLTWGNLCLYWMKIIFLSLNVVHNITNNRFVRFYLFTSISTTTITLKVSDSTTEQLLVLFNCRWPVRGAKAGALNLKVNSIEETLNRRLRKSLGFYHFWRKWGKKSLSGLV